MVRLIIWVVVGLLALSFFGISLRGLVETDTNQDNVSFLVHMIQAGWQMIVLFLQNLWYSLLGLFR